MYSGSWWKFWIVALLTAVFVLWPSTTAAVLTTPRTDDLPAGDDAARARLMEGFHQVLWYFAERDFSLLKAWSEMRGSGDPDFFEHNYPSISRELDSWASTLEKRFDISDDSEHPMDFTFLLAEFAPLAVDPDAGDVMRDNALATVCMICVMDDLRCDVVLFHRFLASVVAEDPSAQRRAEALRWWRRSGGFIDEGLLETVLASAIGTDPDLRMEIARTLFGIGTRRSLQAQRRLTSTAGLPADPSGGLPQIACTAIHHFARARYEEAAPDLLEALADPSLEVRSCAAKSLASLSGQAYLFDPAGDARTNAEAIARWRTWWRQRSTTSPSRSR